ncbi:MAG: hypothetical protein IT350_13420 [Deltaproteobacteria bacterium]|nr:hypothetical protein [Deltaproteobacteria bacterium]
MTGEFDFARLRRKAIGERKSLVEAEQLGRPHAPGRSFADWFDALPDQLAARDLRRVVAAIVDARRAGRSVMLGMGAHVVKVGLTPIVIDLIDRSLVTSVSYNGAVLVHDYELATVGRTSEDVAEALADGSFGITLETGRDFARFVDDGAAAGWGLAEAVGRGLVALNAPYAATCLTAACVTRGVPVTAHVAIGTDVTHLAPELDFAKLGALAGRDFARFIALVEKLDGGVYLNLGSAVVMPEVFLKAVSAARNTGAAVSRITTVNMDFIRHYRPITNVVTRPTASGGWGCHLTGHHEILFPLLAAAVVEKWENRT